MDRCRALGLAHHIARCESWWANGHLVRSPTTPGDQTSQRTPKRVEEIFGWAKTVGGGRKRRYLGGARNRLWVELTAADFIPVRISSLVAGSP